MSYRTITIFSDTADSNQQSGTVVGSILIHGLALGIIGYGIMYQPRIAIASQHAHYTVRHISFSIPKGQMQRSPIDDVNHGLLPSEVSVSAAADRMAAIIASQRPLPEATRSSQTLVQADLRSHLNVPVDIQLPAFVIWAPSKVTTKSIVPPLETSYGADVTPSMIAPNAELSLKEIAITATDLPARTDQNPSGTSSPVRIDNAAVNQKSLVTVSQKSEEPTPVAVVSVSDFQMIDKKAVLPPVIEVAGSNTLNGDGQMPGHRNESTSPHTDQPGGNAGETHTRQLSANEPSVHGYESSERALHDDSDSSRVDASSNLGSQGSGTIISLPKDGHFGAVVVGTSLQDRFPEMEGLWSGRLVYTVYLHVGLAQSWILQYSLPRSAEATAAGNVAHLDAPWPYTIVRPDLPYGSLDADALIVSGFINQEGRFETPKLVFPAALPEADSVLHCLEQWQFRPGTQDGHPTRLEVMLIIPDREG